MQKTYFIFFVFFFATGLSLSDAQSDDCTRLLREAADSEKNKQYDRALKKYLSAKEECDAATSAEVNRRVLAVFEKIEQQRQEAEAAKRQAEANAARARNAEHKTQLEKQKAERSSEANRLAALALSKAKTNPTLGRHLAAMAWEMSLDSSGRYCTEPGVVSVMHSIASDASAWMYRPLKGHTGPVRDVAFSPDGQTIATCGADLTVRLWNMAGEQLRTFNGHRQVPNELAFSPDGKWILSTERDTVYLWGTDGTLKHVFGLRRNPAYPTKAVFSPDSRHVLTVNSNETAIVWNVATGDTARVLSNNYLKKQIINARYSPDGASLLLESYDTKNPKKNFLLTDTTGNTQDTLWGEKGYPFEVAFTPDGSSLAMSKGRFVYLKDIKTRRLDSIPIQYSDSRFLLHPKNKLLIIIEDNEIKVWDYSSAPVLKNTIRYTARFTREISFAWYDRYLVASSQNGFIHFFDLYENNVTKLGAHTGQFAIAVSPDSRYVASAGPDGRLLLWYRNMEPVLASPTGRLQLFISPDGQRIVCGEVLNQRYTLNLLDAQVNKVAALDVKTWGINNDDVKFIMPSRYIAVRGGDSTIRIFDFDGRLRSVLFDTGFDINRYHVSPSGEYIFGINSFGSFRVWTPKGEKVGKYDNAKNGAWVDINNVHLSPDGSQFCMLGDSSIKVFDSNGSLSADIAGRFANCGFSPAGNLFALLHSPEYKMKIWDKNNRQIAEIPNPYLYKFSPTGHLLLVSQGNKVFLWDIARHASEQWELPYSVDRMAFGQGERLYLTTNNNQNYITYVQDFNGRELGRFSGAISSKESKGFLPDNRLFCYKIKGNNTEYFQILDQDNRIVEVLEGLPNMGGHDVSADGRLKLAWDQSDQNKVIIWNEDGRPLRTLTSFSNNVTRAFFSPDSRYIVIKTNMGDELWETPTSYLLRSKTLGIADLIKAGAGVSKDSALSSNDAEMLSEVADFYFYDRNDPDNAEAFYERLESVRHTPRALMQIYDIARQTGRKFDIQRFSTSGDAAELIAYADFLRDRKTWNDARDLYEKALTIKANAHCLFQLNVIADTLKQSFDFERYQMLTGNAIELNQAASSNYYAQKWSQARRLYEMSEHERHLTENLLQLQRISEQPGQEPLDFNRLISSEDVYELEQYAYHFLNARQWAKAQPLFEKAENIQHNVSYLNNLQIIADSLSQDFDFARFVQMQQARELNNSADFFFNRREWEKARILYEKSDEVEPTSDVYVFLRRIKVASKTGVPFDIQKAIRSAGRNFLQSAVTETFRLAQDSSESQKDIFLYLDILRQLEEKLFTIDTISNTRLRIASSYNRVAWNNLFTLRESHAKAVELSVRRGLELAPDENTNENKILKTNMPTALVLQGRFEEAWREWYEPLKDRLYGLNKYATYRDVFLGDIERLVDAGVKHPDFEKVKARLKAADGN